MSEGTGSCEGLNKARKEGTIESSKKQDRRTRPGTKHEGPYMLSNV